MLTNRILPKIIYFREKHHLSPSDTKRKKKWGVKPDFGAPSAGSSSSSLAVPRCTDHEHLKKPTTFSAINCTFHFTCDIKEEEISFVSIQEDQMHVNQYCSLHNWKKPHKQDLKIDSTTSGIFLLFFLFLNIGIHTYKAAPTTTLALFFLSTKSTGNQKITA